MKGSGRSKCDSKVDSQHHGRMSAEHLNKPSGTETCNSSCGKDSQKMENCGLASHAVPRRNAQPDGRMELSILLHSTVPTVSYVTLCWYQREHDQVRHHSCPVCISPLLVLCVLFGPRNSDLGKGRKLEPHLHQRAVLFDKTRPRSRVWFECMDLFVTKP